MSSRSAYSVVEYFGEDEDGGHECGYCKGHKSSLSHGMWGHALSNQDYQDLIDRGWRRSGKYLYKPIMDRTCCPQYTIRCDVAEFAMSRSHKRVLKRFRNYVINGRKEQEEEGDKRQEHKNSQENVQEEASASEATLADARMNKGEGKVKLKGSVKAKTVATGKDSIAPGSSVAEKADNESKDKAKKSKFDSETTDSSPGKSSSNVRPGSGADPNKPKARKAKDIRRERAMRKRQEKGGRESPIAQQKKNAEKTLSDYLDEPFPPNSAHRFEVRTVWAQTGAETEFGKTFPETLKVYQKYQTSVHGDRLSKVTAKQFTRFLCDSSLAQEGRETPATCPEAKMMGGFQQQYLIDGRIFCVGVVDILPHCLSSVYLFYDPEFAFLSPGTLSSLFEVHFARRAALPYYYMGFYIHDCPKMRYKAQLKGSYLLCPETYEWVNMEECRPLLDASKYSRLNRKSGDNRDEEDLESTMILYNRTAMPYRIYKTVREPESSEEEDDAQVREYSRLVGLGPSGRMLLFRA